MPRPAKKPKPTTIKVWVYPEARDELRRFGNILAYKDIGGIRRVPATLTFTPPPRRRRT